MTALLAVLAVAGYQNRDKLAELLRGATGGATGPGGQPGGASGQAGPLSGLGGLLAGGSLGGLLNGGLRDVVDRFRQSGQGPVAESWVAQGPNQEVTPTQLETALGADTLDAIARETGLSRQEIVQRLTRELPTAVDRYTPEGRLPDPPAA
jgi:uncharacterized protein YidB (DUF937 family)